MTVAEYNLLPPEKQKQFQTHRTCYECQSKLVRDGHSTGSLHAVCPKCNFCPDCDEGE